MAGREATWSGFRARAGTLTLFFVTSSMPHARLLELLERALQGGLMGPVEGDLSREELLERYREGLEEYGYIPEEDVDYDDEDDEDEEELADETSYFDDSPLALLEGDRVTGPEGTYETTAKGEQGFFVASVLRRWLRNHPGGPLKTGLGRGQALASLVCCWSATVTHALAREPLTLAELDRVVDPIEDPETLEEHVKAMERAGHVKALPGGDEPRYGLTDWMREGIAPIAAAARMELHYPEEGMAPPDILDVEAGFQLALPLLRLPLDLRGSCRLGVQIPGGPPLMAGATANVDRGGVVNSTPLLEEDPETWATGSPIDWLDTLVDPGAGRIKVGGDTRLAEALIQSLHEKLFAPPEL